MEIRVLQYFLAIAREESITGAAEFLHITQPTLSRQIKELEDQFGKQLFIRGNRKIILTEEGMLLKKRAEEILSLVEKTECEMTSCTNTLSGEIHIGAAESPGFSLISEVIAEMQKEYPMVRFHIHSGNGEDVKDKIDKGILDFGIIIDNVSKMSQYDFIELPYIDHWGVIIQKDHPLSQKDVITSNDLCNYPLICSGRSLVRNKLDGWLEGNEKKLNVIANYNLLYNASLLAQSIKDSVVLTFDGVVNTSSDSPVCFRPLYPNLESHLFVVWKKYQVFSKSSLYFLNLLKEIIKEKGEH